MKRAKIKYIFLLSFVISIPVEGLAFNYTIKDRNILYLINKEEKLLQKNYANQITAEMLYRKMELKFEKSKIIKKYENDYYLEQATKGNIIKDPFKESTQLLNTIRNIKNHIQISFPNFKQIASIHYNFALMVLDFKEYKEATQSLIIANKLEKEQTQLKADINSALADIYYIDKKYDKAIPLYQNAITITKDKWKTKAMFNLAWSQLKTNKYQLALNTLLSCFNQSSKQNYFIDLSDQVFKHAPLFFVLAQEFDQGIDFYKKNQENWPHYLLGFIPHLRERGHSKEAFNIIELILKNTQNQNDAYLAYNAKLSLNLEFKNMDEHFKVAKEMTSKFQRVKLDPDEKQKSINSMINAFKFLNIQDKANAKKYLHLLADFDNENMGKYYYELGTLNNELGLNQIAATNYLDALENAKDARSDQDLRKTLYSSLLSTVENFNKSDVTLSSVQVKSFNLYLTDYPKGDKSSTLYRRLFSHYNSASNLPLSEAILNQYEVNHENEHNFQKDMNLALMSLLIKLKDDDKYANYLEKIQKPKYQVSKLEVDELFQIYAALLESQASQFEETKNYSLAIAKMEQILKLTRITTETKFRVTYNVIVMLLQNKFFDKAQNYLSNMQNNIPSKYLSSNIDKLNNLANLFYDLQFGHQAYSFNKSIIQRFCQDKLKIDNKLINNHVYFTLSINSISSLLNDIEHNSCLDVNNITNIYQGVFIDYLASSDQEGFLQNFEALIQTNIAKNNILTQFYERLRNTPSREMIKLFQNYENKFASIEQARSINLFIQSLQLSKKAQSFSLNMYPLNIEQLETSIQALEGIMQNVSEFNKLGENIIQHKEFFSTINSYKSIYQIYTYAYQYLEMKLKDIQMYIKNKQSENSEQLWELTQDQKDVIATIQNIQENFSKQAGAIQKTALASIKGSSTFYADTNWLDQELENTILAMRN